MRAPQQLIERAAEDQRKNRAAVRESDPANSVFHRVLSVGFERSSIMEIVNASATSLRCVYPDVRVAAATIASFRSEIKPRAGQSTGGSRFCCDLSGCGLRLVIFP
jgi:hypothetical protein